MSVRQYAKRRRVNDETVRRAIETGRLRRSVVEVPGKGGRPEPKIADPDLADREWDENTRPREVSAADGESTGYRAARTAREQEAAKLAELKREAAELDLAARRGELVSAAEVRARLAEEYTAVKTRLLAIPSRVKQQLAHLSPSDVRAIDALIREALEELADDAA